MRKIDSNFILKGSFICLFVGALAFLCHSVVFAQASQFFRTYKKDVPAKIPETSDAIAAGKKIYEKWCYYCHGAKGDGNGPAAPRLDPKPRNFTRNEYKIRSTGLGALPTDEDLFRIISSGIEGSAMPFWSTLAGEERWQVTYFIKTFYEAFKELGEAHEVVPISAEIPSDPESVKRGKELFKEAKCFLCHGEDGKADGKITTTLKGKWDLPYKARNLTKSWLFKGGNATKDIYRTITTGFNETPMGSYAADLLTDDDRWHLAHYVKSISREMKTEVVLKSKLVEGDLPEGPDGETWETISSVEMPLAGQIIANPRLWTPSANSIRIKSLYNNEDIAFLLEWDDTTNEQDEVYSDAVALQFPTKIPESSRKPYFAMGESGKSVVIWHWRAYDESLQTEEDSGNIDLASATDGGSSIAEQEETDNAEAEGKEEVTEVKDAQEAKEKFKDFATIKEMNAKGFKNFAVQPSDSQDSKGKGYWKNGKWKVMITRPLVTGDKKKDIQFEKGKLIPYALAVWDGSNSEIGGQKSISSWYFLALEKTASKSVYLYVIIALIMGASIQFWVIARIRRFPPKVPDED